MTNYESTSYHVEDEAGESVAFTVLPTDRLITPEGAVNENEPVLKAWSTQLMPDNQVINVEVGMSFADVKGLQSFLTDQFGGRKARELPSETSDDIKAEYFKNGWQTALAEILNLATVQGQGEALKWAFSQLPPGQTDPATLRQASEEMVQSSQAPGMAQPSDFYGGQADAQPRQCPAISNGVQCFAAEGHQQFHDFGATQAPPSYTGDGAATPPATAPMATPGAAGGEQAAVSATGAANTDAAPSSVATSPHWPNGYTGEHVPSPAPTEKKRTRRTKLEMAFDRAQESGDQQAIFDASAALEAKDPGNERLHREATLVSHTELPNGNVQVAYTPPAPEQPTVQFAGEPVNPFTQPAPVSTMPAAAFHPGGVIQVNPIEQQAAAAFPCPAVHSDGIRKCVRPYGHELQTANNPEPKPHAFATDPATMQAPEPVAPFLPAPPMQPAAFSVTTPALTGVTDGGAQILSFQTPPTPAFPIQGATLQPPAPAAPFLQPMPSNDGGQ